MSDKAPNSPVVSVVMPLYNNGNQVQRAVESVLRQSFAAFELIVVNDGSTDGGDSMVRKKTDARIRIIDQINKGVSSARNRGVAESKSEIVAFLDADDEWNPDFLDTIIRLRTNYSTCSVFATQYLYRELDGSLRQPILRRVPPGGWEGILNDYFNVATHSDPPLWSSAVAVKKEALLSIGGFPEGVAIGEDLLTWARLALKHQIAYSKKYCAIFWLRGPLTGYPTRSPEIPDRVGGELIHLLPSVEAGRRKDFRRYISLWHRMRASMFVQLGDRGNAMVEVRKMAYYSPGNPQIPVYFLTAISPELVRKVVVKFFNFVRVLRRRILQ